MSAFHRVVTRADLLGPVAELCDLTYHPGRRWNPPVEPDLVEAAWDPGGVMTAPPVLGLNREPAEAGVFTRGREAAIIWDDHRDGFGLGARVGAGGVRLRQASAIAEAEAFARENGLRHRQTVTGDGSLVVRLYPHSEEDSTVSQPEIIIEVDAKGGTTVTVDGVKGESCTLLTAGLEEALGKVKDREFLPEYHQQAPPTTQRVNVGQRPGG
jgi:hypothetical protein